jgi:S-adenosylmethionine hydrolase
MNSTGRADTVFFLSDYGIEDEFVGVVHAVLAAASPGGTIIDLTHQVPAFDVAAGSRALVRASPYLGPGVVLAVVDPGVGSLRRGVCLPVSPPGAGPTYFVGPDNGLLVAAAELVGEAPIARAFALHRRREAGEFGSTFDGRDLFAPAAAALSAGRAPEELGDPIDPDSLVRLAGALVEFGSGSDGRPYLRAEVLWVDRFGNIQLAATAVDAQAAELPRSEAITLVGSGVRLRRVGTFDDLAPGELGLIVDANGQVAVVAGQAPAAASLGASAGDIMVLTW